MKNNLLIISNDILNINKNVVSSDYNDTINIIESLSEKNNLNFFCRTDRKKKNFSFKNYKYKKFLKINIFKLKKFKNFKIFMISITPYNFINLLILKLIKKKLKGYIYLRSDGFKEYYYKYGYLGKLIYGIMFQLITSWLKVITVSKKLVDPKKKMIEIQPSEITPTWLVNKKKPNTKKPKLLYVGRYKKEKGIFSLISLINSIDSDIELNILGTKNTYFSTNRKIKYFKELSSTKKIIQFYDQCNIFVLPSFTEGSPKVILESLVRNRPIIIFKEINHVKKNFGGIFVCNREPGSFEITIKYILKNYNKIITEIKKNKIYTKKEFQNKLSEIIE